MSLTVRAASAQDLSEWVRLRTLLWPECPPDEQAAETRAMLDAKDMTAFVAEREGGGLGGFVEVRLRPYADGCSTSPVGFVEGWYVDAELRRVGVGASLVRAAEQWARSRGCSEMASDAELHNQVSHAAHEGLGYEGFERVVRYRKRL
jgi:aminoglycoside 6'-N-acetyltransferase I